MRILTTGSKEVSGRVETVSITLRLFGGCRLLCSTFHRLCCSVDDDSSSLGALLYTDRLSASGSNDAPRPKRRTNNQEIPVPAPPKTSLALLRSC